ncbi:MAG: hypothetical protein KA876_03570 [Prevotella sp.]|nr:hypothetical protein [Prevotella sp.]
MTQIYLDDTQLYMAEGNIKLTRENAYFTQSGSYTLDVQLPLDVATNKMFFGNIGRLETTKNAVKYKARLVVDNVDVLNGSATIINISDNAVKVQLLGGYSDINFLAKFGEEYIDNINYGNINIPAGFSTFVAGGSKATVPTVGDTDKGLKWMAGEWDSDAITALGDDVYVCMPIYDETNEEIKNKTIIREKLNHTRRAYSVCECVQPNLFYVLRTIIENYGYKIANNDFNSKPWNRIYIASCAKTFDIANVLPHWTIKEFLEQIQYLFNCTFVFDEVHRTVDLKSNLTFFNNAEINFVPIEEFSSEITTDDNESTKSLSSSNVNYSCSDSKEHFYDVISDDIFNGYEHKTYPNKDAMLADMSAMTDADKRKYIFITPTGQYVYGTDDEPDISGGTDIDAQFGGYEDRNETTSKVWYVKQINQFGGIKRKDNNDGIDIKICPVAMSLANSIDYYVPYLQNFYQKAFDMPAAMPSMQNEVGDDLSTKYSTCAWSGIYGEESAKKTDKSLDRIEIFLVEDTAIQYVNKPGVADANKKIGYPMAFTDWLDKALALTDCNYKNVHSSWSLALVNCAAEHYIGQLHRNSYKINTNVEQQIDFIADTIPAVTNIFIFKNKRYACHKLEVSINNNGIDKRIKGYFYEMI